MGGSQKKTPPSWIRELKHDGTMCAMISKFSYYFTDSNGLDSHPSALWHSLLSVLMLPLCVEEKSLSLVIFSLCSHPISLWTATASEQGLLACLLSIFCTAPCNQHRCERHLHPPPRKTTLAPYYPTTIHIHHYTYNFLYCRGHLILDRVQLVNSWYHREHLCEISNKSGTCQGAAVNT